MASSLTPPGGVATIPGVGVVERARELREQAQVSQSAMARHCGVSQSTMARWETGKTVWPGAVQAEAARRWIAVLRFLDATASRDAQ